jgi:hypothetical protein
MKFIDDLVTLFEGFFDTLVKRLRAFVSPSADAPDDDIAFEPLTPEPKEERPTEKIENHRVAGTSFRLEDIKRLMGENAAYDFTKKELIEEGYIDDRVYKLLPYYGSAVLEPEPDNPHDPKAIKVLTAGVHIGYIKAGSCAHIHKVLREGRVKKAEVEIKGGEYKIVLEDCDDYSDKSTYSLERDSIPFHAVLTLTLEQ